VWQRDVVSALDQQLDERKVSVSGGEEKRRRVGRKTLRFLVDWILGFEALVPQNKVQQHADDGHVSLLGSQQHAVGHAQTGYRREESHHCLVSAGHSRRKRALALRRKIN